MTLFTRIRIVVVGLAVLGGAVVGCSGVENLPTVVRSPDALAVSADRDGASDVRGRDTAVVHFTIDPTASQSYNFGSGHRLWVRAGGVCELDSPYGADYWDTPCTPTYKPVQITARTWTDSAGHPAVEFQPKLRFTPLPEGAAAAIVYFHDRMASNDTSAVILYCGATDCVNEATTDPLLLTIQDRYNSFVFRQIKHFSGYEVAVGRSDTPAPVAY